MRFRARNAEATKAALMRAGANAFAKHGFDGATVQVMLRQLHLRVLDVETAREQLAQFDRRLQVAAEMLRRAGETEAVTHLAIVRQKLRESGKKGVLKGADATEVQEHTAAAPCALNAIG
jgi:hypothetical protein